MGRQDGQAGHLLVEREDFAGGRGGPAPAARARNLAAFQQLGSLGEVPGQGLTQPACCCPPGLSVTSVAALGNRSHRADGSPDSAIIGEVGQVAVRIR